MGPSSIKGGGLCFSDYTGQTYSFNSLWYKLEDIWISIKSYLFSFFRFNICLFL